MTILTSGMSRPSSPIEVAHKVEKITSGTRIIFKKPFIQINYDTSNTEIVQRFNELMRNPPVTRTRREDEGLSDTGLINSNCQSDDNRLDDGGFYDSSNGLFGGGDY